MPGAGALPPRPDLPPTQEQVTRAAVNKVSRSKVKPIEEVLADTLERIATALEELVEVQRTEPLEKILTPSVMRPKIEEKKE